MDITPNENFAIEDEILVCRIQQGNGELFTVLADRYFGVVCAKANSIAQKDTEDIIQEGLMGLWSAVQTYDSDKNTSFRTYAFRCIENAVRSETKRKTGKKYIPNANIVYLDSDNANDIQDTFPNPEDSIIQKEDYLRMVEKIKSVLSKRELKVLSYYLAGNSYQKIAEIMNCDVKSIDNAVQRIRKKLRQSH